MKNAVKMLSALEDTKFSADNDFLVLNAALDLIFQKGKPLWNKGAKERQFFLDILAGKTAFSREVWQKSKGLEPVVCFMQGALLLSMSLLNGIGRSPLSAQKTAEGYKIKILNKLQTISLIAGRFDRETENLLREFKHSFFGKTAESFGKNDLAVIKEALRETSQRLNNEKALMAKIAGDPLQLFDGSRQAENTFISGLFLLIAALPAETMNLLFMQIGSHLPEELEGITEDRISVNARSYFSANTQDLRELFKKTRLLLKLYSGKQQAIIALIVKDKTAEFFRKQLAVEAVKEQVKLNLAETIKNQIDLRMETLNSIVKIL
ncbi:MAG: hypothetical protein LBD99_01920 [Candidatus Margulisbacteria bacterium]|jgi:hypothetical protein|nr:hypothetical protein [Candidatus Margulisiibacteriota bacterium]